MVRQFLRPRHLGCLSYEDVIILRMRMLRTLSTLRTVRYQFDPASLRRCCCRSIFLDQITAQNPFTSENSPSRAPIAQLLGGGEELLGAVRVFNRWDGHNLQKRLSICQDEVVRNVDPGDDDIAAWIGCALRRCFWEWEDDCCRDSCHCSLLVAARNNLVERSDIAAQSRDEAIRL